MGVTTYEVKLSVEVDDSDDLDHPENWDWDSMTSGFDSTVLEVLSVAKTGREEDEPPSCPKCGACMCDACLGSGGNCDCDEPEKEVWE
jgi:hypothetical protein